MTLIIVSVTFPILTIEITFVYDTIIVINFVVLF